ncbi:hypothetical protein [Streptomyces sp. NPDC060194]|uniref:hypothetical protein n=1 Tax=Streptomyces sp. NPDC060194 TaxID=3347069 RepID=UPI003667EC7B
MSLDAVLAGPDPAGGGGAAGAVGPGASQAAAAVNDMRAVARWSLATTGAVGGVLLGGLPIAAVGKIRGAADGWLAGGGLALALVGICAALWATGNVLTPRFVTLRSLQERPAKGLRAEIAAAPAVFLGGFGTDPAALATAYEDHAKLVRVFGERLDRATDEAERAAWAGALADARANVAAVTARGTALLELVHVWHVQYALRRARILTLLASILVVAGAVMFLLATDGGG